MGDFSLLIQNTNKSFNYSPDFRKWEEEVSLPQNQRLVYWPMLKSGDFDMMKSQFDFIIIC